MPVRPSPSTGTPMPSVWEIFKGFFTIGINGFGGVLPWARWMMVEQRKWLTPDEFIDMLAMCQLLPGPNICNLSVAVGGRFQGVAGSLAGLGGLLLAPIAIVLIAYTLLLQVAEAPVVIGALHGMSAVAAGLVVALGIKLAMPLIKKRDFAGFACTLAAIAAVGILRVPLLPALAVLMPIGIAVQVLRVWRQS